MSSIAYSEQTALQKARKQSKSKMSVTQTFVLAHKARSKLSREASRPDHDLRHLVLTANLLDSLMLHLSHAELDQEVRKVNATHFPNSIIEESKLPWTSIEESDDFGDEEQVAVGQRSPKTPYKPYLQSVTTVELSYSEEEEESDEEDGFYSLQRSPSRPPSSFSPPSLVEDLEDSDDESNPPSPRQAFSVPVLTEKERQSLVTTSFYDQSSEDPSSVPYINGSVQIQQSVSLIAAF